MIKDTEDTGGKTQGEGETTGEEEIGSIDSGKCRDSGYRTQCEKTEAEVDEGESREQQTQDGVERRERRQGQWGNETGLEEGREKMRKRGKDEVDSREI